MNRIHLGDSFRLYLDNTMKPTTVEILKQTVDSYRVMIDRTVAQLTDAEFFQRPSPEINSVAVILRHLGGNLASRWTNFLTTDGEKETRDRDKEFTDWHGTRVELMEYFDLGWKTLLAAMDEINATNINHEIKIRGESHTVIQALVRSVTHLTYHVGQISLVSRLVHDGQWDWLTIAPNRSGDFNEETWGTSKSRAVFDVDKETN